VNSIYLTIFLLGHFYSVLNNIIYLYR